MSTFRRKVLLQKLNTVAPALANNDIVPEFTYFSFDGARIVAFNEQIALSAPQYGDYQGLLPPLLLEVLASSSAPAVQIEGDGEGGAQVTLGASVTCLPMQPLEHYRFEMPTARPQHRVTACFLHGVRHCLHSVSAYATVADQLGVTLITDGQDDLRLFATNRSTISDARVSPAPFKLKRRVILPTAFCDQMLRLAKTAKVLRLEIFSDYALFSADDAVLFGWLIGQRKTPPLDFVRVVNQHLPKDFAHKSVAVPKGLRAVVKRASCLTSVVGSETKTKIIVEGGVATVEAVSERGLLSERLALPKHPDVEINVNARLLVEGLRAGLDRVLFTHRCALLARGEHYFLAAAFDD